MYNYELCFIGCHQDEIEGELENYYMQETSWQIRTNKTYDEMVEYVKNLNLYYQAKYHSQSFFDFNQMDVLDGCPDFEKLEHDLKEL